MLVASKEGCPATDLPKGYVLIQSITLWNRRKRLLSKEGRLLFWFFRADQ